ncbi:MAG: MBL fold metallo-hydrolase [Ignavibacteria bacterium]|nr:MBL fold metallo-hydrolase [Ignavibacteria bacterium]
MSDNKLRFTILGSGTSSGVPTISCKCPTCLSTDPRDKRLRTSLLVQSDTTSVVIDTTPDFRQQMLTYNVEKLDAVVFTHAHFDHIGGLDDLRAYNYTTKKPVQIFANAPTLNRIKRTFFYIFEEPEQIGGGLPELVLNEIDTEPFQIGNIRFEPLKLFHGKMLVLGFRIGNLAYCTDTNHIPQETIKKMKGLDYLILDALRYDKHSTHYNLEEAIRVAKVIKARTTYFIHIAHQILHSKCEKELPNNIHLSYDGLQIIL